jgi:hypothetical protein
MAVMNIHHVYERSDVFVVFAGESTVGLHYEKDSDEGKDIQAYLSEHPEALVDEPLPPRPTPEQVAAAEAARAELAEIEADKAFYRAFRKASEAGDMEPLKKAMQAVSKLKEVKEL